MAKLPKRQPASAPHAAPAYEAVTGSVEATQAIGQAIGRQLKPGQVVAFYGDLGAGKTTLIQGIAQGLGADANRVKSPTFVLMREYPGSTPIVHIDGYRLEGATSIAWLDIELIFTPSKVTLIEWAERFGELLPPDYLEVRLEHVSNHRRRVRIVPHGAGWETLPAALPSSASAEPPTEPADSENAAGS